MEGVLEFVVLVGFASLVATVRAGCRRIADAIREAERI